ncbi:MAG: ABC transporter substrate-binding protein [Opitutales bacterium]
MIRPALVVLLSLSVGWWLAGCGKQAGPADGRVPVTVEHDWLAVPEQGGFFQALMEGYFADTGLDVTIRHGGPYDLTPQNVALGKADIGMASSDEVIVAVGRGMPLVIFMPFFQHHPYALMSHREQAVKTFGDLDGRTVTAFPGATWIPYVKNKYDVEFGISPVGTSIAQFIADKTRMRVEQIFLTNEPFFAAKNGVDPHVLRIGESGLDPYRVMFTTRSFMADHPEVLRGFTEAALRGWSDYLSGGDTSAADAEIIRRNSQMTPEYIDWVKSAIVEHRLVRGRSDDQTQATLDLERLEAEIADLYELELIPEAFPVDRLATTAFLPAGRAGASATP